MRFLCSWIRVLQDHRGLERGEAAGDGVQAGTGGAADARLQQVPHQGEGAGEGDGVGVLQRFTGRGEVEGEESGVRVEIAEGEVKGAAAENKHESSTVSRRSVVS